MFHAARAELAHDTHFDFSSCHTRWTVGRGPECLKPSHSGGPLTLPIRQHGALYGYVDLWTLTCWETVGLALDPHKVIHFWQGGQQQPRAFASSKGGSLIIPR